MRLGMIFPGQGSQKVGMGKDIYDAHADVRQMFSKAQEVLGIDLASICFDGPNELLTKTQHAQPALFLVSAGLCLLLKERGIHAHVVAGHSLGEITAYYAAGVIDLPTALAIIKKRGQGMADSYPSSDSGMAAIMMMDIDTIREELVAFNDVPVVIANINSPVQVVISGKKQGVLDASKRLSDRGARVFPLNVSGAFHSPLMAPGSLALSDFVKTQHFSDASIDIILNRTSESERYAETLRENLPLQVISSVRWAESMQRMGQVVDHVVEVGSGNVLTGLMRKIDSTISVSTVSDLNGIETLLEKVRG